MKTGGVGSSLDDFLAESGIQAEVTTAAVKRVFAWQLEEARAAKGMTKSEMAKAMKTSRAQLDRTLDPSCGSASLNTMVRAALVLGKRIQIVLEDP